MSHQVLSVKPDLPMSEAAQIMLQKQVREEELGTASVMKVAGVGAVQSLG
jgi:hypothetical protein